MGALEYLAWSLPLPCTSQQRKVKYIQVPRATWHDGQWARREILGPTSCRVIVTGLRALCVEPIRYL